VATSALVTAVTLVTVLYPDAIVSSAVPSAVWTAPGTLVVNSDTIEFAGGPGTWQLASVNGEAATGINRTDERLQRLYRTPVLEPRLVQRARRPNVLTVSGNGTLAVASSAGDRWGLALQRLDGRQVEVWQGEGPALLAPGVADGLYVTRLKINGVTVTAPAAVVGK
jgi:hypothetical protein